MTDFPFDPQLEHPIAVRPAADDVDLDSYRRLGKIPWEERYEAIIDDYPSVADEPWAERFDNDLEVLGRVLRDILKLEQAVPGRPGPRPSLDVDDAQRRLAQLRGEDYTLKPFIEAVSDLKGKKSIRQFAHKVNLDRNTVHRALHGKIEPDAYLCRMIAYAHGKHPSYFIEWRILYIVGAIVRRLEWNPESSIALYERLDRASKKKKAVA